MPRRAVNTNRQGANFELQIMKDLTRYGYIAHRSSGSHGAVDVVAVGDQDTLVIQAKISAAVIPPAERVAVLALADRMGPSAVPMCAYRVAGKVRYRVLTGPAPRNFILWEPEPLARYAMCASCGHSYGGHSVAGWALGCWVQEDGWSCPCGRFDLPV